MANSTELPPPEKIGVIVVDHGSRRAESNAMLLDVVALFRRQSGFPLVEPAHMELAEPTLQTAFDRCVDRGAELVIVHPYFLAPGKHWKHDIPALVAEAARRRPGVRFLITAPLGLHALMAEIMRQRIADCLAHNFRDGPPCAVCAGESACRVQSADSSGDPSFEN